MVALEISWEEIKFFIALVVAGIGYGYYVYHRGMRKGWDDLAYLLDAEGIILVDDNGEICRVSDRDYAKFKRTELQYDGD